MNVNKGDEFLLKFEQDKVYLNDGKFIDKSKVDVGPTRIIDAGVRWKISVIKYFPNEKRIYAQIVNYQSREHDFSDVQHGIVDELEIEKISFDKIDTVGLLSSSSPKNKILTTPKTKRKESETIGKSKPKAFRPHLPEEDIKSSTQEINISFDFPIRHISFFDGHVKFTKFIQDAYREVVFTIHNSFLRKEYDSVKNYFEKYLNRKNITVQARIVLTNKDTIDCKANSAEIAKINEAAIESVKFDFIKFTILKPRTNEESDKLLYTLEELYANRTKSKIKSDLFHSSPEELINDVLTIKSSKHYKQLRYLSSKHLSKILNIRIVPEPFSFVFLLENNDNYFLIWETLNTSEATYIWITASKEKEDLKVQLDKMEDIIRCIKEDGKKRYLKSKPDNLRRIYHDYTNKETGIKKWIHELEKILRLSIS